MPEMKQVMSSHVRAVGYADSSEDDTEARTLVVEYDTGRVVRYVDVPPQIARSVMNAPSVGQALHRLVKGKYAFEG